MYQCVEYSQIRLIQLKETYFSDLVGRKSIQLTANALKNSSGHCPPPQLRTDFNQFYYSYKWIILSEMKAEI